MSGKLPINSDESELLQGFALSDAWKALDKCITAYVGDYANRVLTSQPADLQKFKSEYDGAVQLHQAIKQIKKKFTPR